MLLNCHTYYSFCYGTLSIKDLLNDLVKKGYDSFVLSDINNTSAILDALRLTEKRKPKVIPGIDFRNGIKQQYIGIAKNNIGFKELNEHLSYHLHLKKDFEDIAPNFKNAFVVYPLAVYKNQALNQNEFIGITAKELSKLPFTPYKNHTNKMVVLQSVSFKTKSHFNAHRLLRAIDKNVLLSKLPIDEQTSPEEIAPSKEELYKIFSEHPEIIQNTELILNNCSVVFVFGKLANKNLKYYTQSLDEDMQLLEKLCMDGLTYRYPHPNEIVFKRIEKELHIIREKCFASYYLINWDIIQYARSKNYFYVGRGSGANSMVAYLLRITDVDPIDLDLYFERFINEHRSNAPDFDIDFSWTDRDDITHYIFKRFGYERTALLATYSTFQHDAVTRELGKVFGLPAGEIERLQKVRDIKDADSIGKLVLKYSALIAGFPSHLSIHSSGILISEEPITIYSATFLPPKGYPTTQFSMLEAEDIGLFKFDILSQRGLGKIKDAVEIIKQNKNVEIDIHDIPKFKHDEEIKKLLKIGKCIGCFYIESPAMRMLLSKLEAEDYLRLVAASSIIRPGVSKSGMMREYIVRYRQKEKREQARAALPELYELLEETYGVMVYQEDVIKIAHEFAGLSLADADYLRRGMSWKFKQRNEFEKVKEKFYNNCLARGYALNVIENIWTQIESFANFAFSKGHSASYAVESYQALYLKAYYPLEYMVATLNNGGGFYRKDLYVHEARMHDAIIIAPCVNTSTQLCEIKDKTIFLGLAMVSELEQNCITKIIEERNTNGFYTDLYNFIKRTHISIEQLRILIRVGAFNSLYKNKRELMWEAHMLISPIKPKQVGSELFDVEPERYVLPKLNNTWLDDAMDEIELLGFSLCSPFQLLKDKIKNKLLSRDLKKQEGKSIEIIGYLVNIKSTRTSKDEKMCFGTFLDLEGYWIDTVHFPPSARTFPFNGPGCYRIIGKVVNEFDFIYIDVSHQYRLAMINKDDLDAVDAKVLLMP
jgi:DNA polymerase-3 subunit alpha